MSLGAWKSFDDLEESLTLDEVFELYEMILEREHEEFRRRAGLEGVEVPPWGEDEEEEEPEQTERESLKERVIRRRAEQEGKDPEQEIAKEKFGEGVGYKLIGG